MKFLKLFSFKKIVMPLILLYIFITNSPISAQISDTPLQNLQLNLKVYLEGFWNGTSLTQDTVKVYLAQGTPPYDLRDSAKVYLSTTGNANPVFTNAEDGYYYIVLQHRNHIETWSKYPQHFVSGVTVNYNFTDSLISFGWGMKKIGTIWVLFGGDANKDGYIDAYDAAIFIPQYGTIGYLNCDFDGNNDINAIDAQMLISNYLVSKVTPGMDMLTPGQRNDNQDEKLLELKKLIKKSEENNQIKND